MRIDDLRTTLNERADLTRDEGLIDRAGSVRGRVRTVRRRRAAVAVACVTGAVLVVPTLRAFEVSPPEPASSRDLAGRTAPATLVSNGYTFEFDRGVEGTTDEPLDLELGESDEPRLVSWTVNADADADAPGDGSAGAVDGRLTDRKSEGSYSRDWTAGGTGFETYEYLPAAAPGTYRLVPATAGATGKMAMAVYTLSDEPPAGVSGQGITFRDEVDGAELLGAAIGEPGESGASFDITLPEGMLRVSDVCTAPAEDFMVHVRVAGQQGWSGTSCAGEASADAAGGGWFGFDLVGRKKTDGSRFRAGETVRLTARIHPDQRDRSEPVEVPGAFVGLAAYLDGTGATIGATEETVDELIEVDGHTWALTELDTSTPGSPGHRVRLGPVDEITYVDLGAANDPPPSAAPGFGRDVAWSTRIDGDRVGRSSRGPSGSSNPALEIRLDRGESMTIEQRAVGGGSDEYLSFYVASYTLAD